MYANVRLRIGDYFTCKVILFPVTILTTIIVRFSYEGRLHVLAIPAARSGATAGAGANGAPASGKRRDAAIVAATHTQK